MKTPENKTFDRIEHIALCVSDLEQTARWYETSFQCKIISMDQTEAQIQFENIRLTLVRPSYQNPHIGFEREDAHSFGELRQQHDGSRSAFLSDPSGNLVELQQPDKE